jgi:hypothetical protein
MASSSFQISTSSNYDSEFSFLSKFKTPPKIPISIKLLSGDLIHLELAPHTTLFDFYEIVYKHLSGLPEYHSIRYTDIILYRTVDEENTELLEHISKVLSPTIDEIFHLFIEPFPFSIYFCNEDIRLTGNNSEQYVVINLSIEDNTKSYPDNKITNKDFILRRPTSKADRFIPQIWSIDHVDVQHMRFTNFGDWGYIQNPNPDLVINDPTRLVSDLIRENPYFFTGTTHGFRRAGVLYKLLGDNFDRLMKMYLSDN